MEARMCIYIFIYIYTYIYTYVCVCIQLEEAKYDLALLFQTPNFSYIMLALKMYIIYLIFLILQSS